jgi:hypothetical protein
MLTREQAGAEADRELEGADAGRTAGNEGRVRVCARRAAGVAIAYWLQFHPRPGWGNDAVSRLRGLQDEDSVPDEIRAAARRLGTRVTEKFAQPLASDPVTDAQRILEAMLSA